MSLIRLFHEHAYCKTQFQKVNDMTRIFKESDYKDANTAAIDYFVDNVELPKFRTGAEYVDWIERNVPMKETKTGDIYYQVNI